MKRSLVASSSPAVVTLLSPGLEASRRLAKQLSSALASSLPSSSTVLTTDAQEEVFDDALNQALGKTPFSSAFAWDSITVGKEGGARLHLLSPASNGNNSSSSSSSMGLLAVQQVDSVGEARAQLAQVLPGLSASSARLLWQQRIWKKPITVNHLLRGGLPFFDWSTSNRNERNSTAANDNGTFVPGQLKEIAIPFYDDNTLLFEKLASLERPVTGLYQLPCSTQEHSSSSLCLRPLPSAKEDRKLPPPSLIFHVDSVQDYSHVNSRNNNSKDSPVAASRIGFTGIQSGQLILTDMALSSGLDIRLCDSQKRSSMFNEAQESLLAASLDELQSTQVLRSGNSKDDDDDNNNNNSQQDDPRQNNMDCWVEFRANMKRPAGFLPQGWSTRKQGPRVAKAPNIPPE